MIKTIIKEINEKIENELEKGWNQFVDSVRAENAKSNERLFKSLNRTHGKDFVKDLKRLHKKFGGFALIRFSNQPKGVEIINKDFPNIKMLINATHTDGAKWDIYIPIKKNKYLFFTHKD